jgi:hypothetical protein
MFLNPKKGTVLVFTLTAAVSVAIAVATAAPLPRLAGSAPIDTVDHLSLTETYCDQRATVGTTLTRDFGEVPRLAALTGAGMMMELWASDLAGSWTVVHHGSDGISCIVTTGLGWMAGADDVVLMEQALAEAVYQS